MELLELAAVPGDSGRLDAWLAAQCPTLSRSALQGLIEQGLVTRDGAPVNKKEKVAPGAVYRVALPDPQPIEAQPQNIPLDIVYEDDDLLVVNKPKGMVVHPAPGNPDGTLVKASAARSAPVSYTASIRIPAVCWWWPKTMRRIRRLAPR